MVDSAFAVAVGSSNPAKVAAVRSAVALILPDETVAVCGYDIPSGVRDQPMSHDEAITGARNRATGARAAQDAEYGVGIESGLEQIAGMWFTSGWVAIVDRHGNTSLVCSMLRQVPAAMIDLVQQGMELGHATDKVFGTVDSKRSTGLIGVLTGDILTRESVFRDATIAAFATFRHPDHFGSRD